MISAGSKMSTCLRCKSKEAKYHCGRCKERLYCGKECQVTDWKQHKIKCSKMGENKVNTSAEKILHELNNPSQATRLEKGIVELLEYMPSCVRKRVHLDIPNFQEEYQQNYPQEKEHVGILKDAFNDQKLYPLQELVLDNVPWNVGNIF
ncbi:N-lysine methyltransferase SMYD2-like [Hydractinia symbiolongicarpus]|uniref:N-lysine methyltransferase SMYD2-like n=1 Tax=Hydractinia symbiolongicarpus TaxID=13093 RepID=UPI00254D97DD|nr:N-lysine methyltransferase SMYD2-like [Hydractinia symbiolongicarpus]